MFFFLFYCGPIASRHSNVADLFAFLTCVIEATPLEPYKCVAMVKVISLSFILQLQPLLRWWTLGFRVKQKT